MGKKSIFLLVVLLLPYLLNAQIERFKMYENKPESADTTHSQKIVTDSLQNDFYKLGYSEGRKYAKEHNAVKSGGIIGAPVPESKDLQKISSKHSKSLDYQQGFEDGYFGLESRENIEKKYEEVIQGSINEENANIIAALLILVCMIWPFFIVIS